MGVRFRLDGREFELTQEQVRTRLSRVTPEAVREYWVEIDGVRWPVKQVMAEATGLARTRFQSQNSRRLLAKLGFAVGMGASALGAGTGRMASARRTRSTVEVGELSELDSLSVSVRVTWRMAGQITLDAQELPLFPPLPGLPGLYRYDFGLDEHGIRTYYIGESQDLARRARNYRGAKTDRTTQRTSRRIHTEVVGHLMTGGTISFAIATEVAIDGATAPDLRLKSARRLAENAAVLIAQQADDVRVLNIDTELTGDSKEET